MSGLGTCKAISFSATVNPVRAKKFYRDKLGLRLVSADPFALVFDLVGRMLRVQIVQEVSHAKYTTLGWEVPDIQVTARELEKAGIKLERFEGMNQDSHGIWESPAGAKIGWFKDPDGNTLSITQF